MPPPIPGLFITGTDTEVGKSWVSAALLERYRIAGLACAAMKPIASGCEQTPEGLRNEDALLLEAHAGVERPYALINPYCFAPPISPHLAAADLGQRIDLNHIHTCFEQLCDGAERVLVEGVGGWYAPLNEQQTVADLARTLGLPVVLVVGLRLGCINHALLTVRAIEAEGLQLVGWVANGVVGAMARREENIATLERMIAAPLLGVVPHLERFDIEALARGLRLPEW